MWFLNDDFNKFNINETIDICKKYNFFSCGINLNTFLIPLSSTNLLKMIFK